MNLAFIHRQAMKLEEIERSGQGLLQVLITDIHCNKRGLFKKFEIGMPRIRLDTGYFKQLIIRPDNPENLLHVTKIYDFSSKHCNCFLGTKIVPFKILEKNIHKSGLMKLPVGHNLLLVFMLNRISDIRCYRISGIRLLG
jgi:hypothetical protein